MFLRPHRCPCSCLGTRMQSDFFCRLLHQSMAAHTIAIEVLGTTKVAKLSLNRILNPQKRHLLAAGQESSRLKAPCIRYQPLFGITLSSQPYLFVRGSISYRFNSNFPGSRDSYDASGDLGPSMQDASF